MKITYDPEADAMYIKLTDGVVSKTFASLTDYLVNIAVHLIPLL